MSADFYATDEDQEIGAASGALVPIIEVPSDNGTSRSGSVATGIGNDTHRSSLHDQNSELDGEDDDVSPGIDSDTSPTSARRTGRRKKKGKNGMQAVEMTPPDRRLKQAEHRAERYRQQGKTDASLRQLIQCTALARIVHGDGHWRLARAYVSLARGYFDLKDYMPQAHYHAEHAKTIMMNTVPVCNSSTDRPLVIQVLIDIYFILGKSLTALKKYSAADAALSRAEKIADELSKLAAVSDSQIDTNTINIARAFAKLNARQQKFAMATTYFEKALASMKLAYGKDSIELIPVYQALGRVEQSRGKHGNPESAIEYFLQAHSIASARYDTNSEHVAATGHAVAVAYAEIGSEEAEVSAESYLNECLVIYQSLFGARHEKTLAAQDELSRLMVRAHRHQEAIDVLRSTIKAKINVYGDFSQEVAEVWKLIGSIHLSQAETDKGLRALKKCHNIECLVHGTNSKKSKDTLRTLDLLLANPHTAAKNRNRTDDLKERPRFSSIVNRGSSLGGLKTQLS